MIKEFELYPPDVGSIKAFLCGCVSWMSKDEFITLACCGSCPTLLAITRQAREMGKPIDHRPAWSR